MVTRASLAWVLCSALAGAVGCAGDDRAPPVEPGPGVNLPAPGRSTAGRSIDDDDDRLDPLADPPLDVFAIDARLVGTLGTIDVDAVPYRMDTSITRGNAHISLFAEGIGGEGMIAFDVRGGLDHEDLLGGLPVTFGAIEPALPDALYVNAIGCSGPNAGMWTYDAPSSEITIAVRPSTTEPDQVEIEVEASFGAGYADSSHVQAFVTLGR